MRPAFVLCLLASVLSLALSAAASAAPAHHPRARQYNFRHSQDSIVPVTPVPPPGWYKFPGYPAIPPEQNRNLDPSNRGSA
jgi:hypothetical protein